MMETNKELELSNSFMNSVDSERSNIIFVAFLIKWPDIIHNRIYYLFQKCCGEDERNPVILFGCES